MLIIFWKHINYVEISRSFYEKVRDGIVKCKKYLF